MENKTRSGRTPAPLYIAEYRPERTFDSPAAAIAAVQQYLDQHPSPPAIKEHLGGHVLATEMSDSALLLRMDGDRHFLIENTGQGDQPRIRFANPEHGVSGEQRLGRQPDVAWFFPEGDPSGAGRSRSEPWTWNRENSLHTLVGMKLAKVFIYPHDLSLYVGEDERIFALVNVYEEHTKRPLLYWYWYD